MANSSDINSAIISSIKGFSNISNTYINVNQSSSGITVNSSGNIINQQNSEQILQNFQLVDNFSMLNDSSNSKTIILIICIILYLIILTRK